MAEIGKIVKHDSASELTPIPFQFDDVRAMAARILKRVNAQAQRKLMAAEKQAQDIEKAAYDSGYHDGHEKGFAKGEAEGKTAGDKAAREAFAQATSGVAPVLTELLAALDARKVMLQAQAEADLLRLSLAIAKRIVRRQLDLDAEHIVPVVREAIGLAVDRSDLIVRVHPEDLSGLEDALPELRTAFTDLGKIRVEADGEIEPGGVRVVGREGEVDMRLSEQFAAIERALIGVDTEPGESPAPGVGLASAGEVRPADDAPEDEEDRSTPST